MKKLMIVGPFLQKHQEKFQSLSKDVICTFKKQDEVTEEDLMEQNALIGNIPVSLIEKSAQLEWIQLTSSGADAYAKANIPNDPIITTSTGAYGIAIAEYMVAMLLNMMKRIPAYLENSKNGIWKDEGGVTTPYGKRILLVGTGNIGLEFAKRMRSFGCELIGVRRRCSECPAELDEIHPMEELKEELAKADVIALSLPGTTETYYLFDKEMLMSCKKGSYFMNVGRGNVLPLEIFLDPEISNHFAGIWLDVTEVEPLPEKHPLFAVQNLYITPHITGGYHLDLTVQSIFDIAYHNMKAWLGMGEYSSVLDHESGYCK